MLNSAMTRVSQRRMQRRRPRKNNCNRPDRFFVVAALVVTLILLPGSNSLLLSPQSRNRKQEELSSQVTDDFTKNHDGEEPWTSWRVEGTIEPEVKVESDEQALLLAYQNPSSEWIGEETPTEPKCDREPGEDKHRYDPLACWLWNLKVAIPDEQFKKDLITVTVKDMMCTNFEIGSVQSSYEKSATNPTVTDPAISLAVAGVHATCTGIYHSTGTGGTVTASVVNVDNKPLNLAITFTSGLFNNTIKMATLAQTTSCEANLQVPSSKDGLHFSGSISAKIINWFSGPIARHVSLELSKELCPTIQSNLDPILSNAIHKADEYMTGLIQNYTNGVHGYGGWRDKRKFDHVNTDNDNNSNEDDLTIASVNGMMSQYEEGSIVDFDRDIPLLSHGLKRFNRFIAHHLDSGLILDILKYFGVETKDGTVQGAQGVGESDNNVDCGFFFRGLNGLMKFVTHGTGSIQWHIPSPFLGIYNYTFQMPKYGIVTVTLKEVNATGLDTFKQLSLLRPWGGHNLHSSVKSNVGFNVSARVDLRVDPVEGGIIQGGSLRETFDVHFNMSDVDIMANAFLAINRERFEGVTVGNLLSCFDTATLFGLTGTLDQHEDVSCPISDVLSATLTDFYAYLIANAIEIVPVTNDTNSSMSFSTSNGQKLEKEIDALLNNILELFLSEYNVLVTDSLTGFVQGPLRLETNKLIKDILQNLSGNENDENESTVTTSRSKRKTTPDFFKFDTSKIMQRIQAFFSGGSGFSSLNSYVSCVADYIENQGSFTGVFYRWLLGGIEVDFSDFQITNLGDVYKFDFMKPEIDSFHLMNRLGVGDCHENDSISTGDTCHAATISLRILASDADMGVKGDMNITLSIGDISLEGGTMLQYDLVELSSLNLAQLLTRSHCAMSPAWNFEVYGLSNAIGPVEMDIDAAFGPVKFSRKLGQEGEISELLASLLSWSTPLTENVLNGISTVTLEQAPYLCRGESAPANNQRRDEPESHRKLLVWNVSVISVAFIAAHLLFFLHRYHKRRYPYVDDVSFVSDDSNDDTEREDMAEPLLNVQKSEKSMQARYHALPKPKAAPSTLMFNKSVPAVIRHIMPIILVGTIALFLASNLSTGASVDLELTGPTGATKTLPNLFSFSLGNTTREMYHAHVYVLMFLIVVFSGMWPYLKLLMMMFAWLASKRFFAESRREHLLIYLDALGKFSLIDAYVLVLMMVAFRYHLALDGVGTLDVFVTPMFGFYGFLVATIMSMISGHVILFFHRRSMLVKNLPSSGPRESFQHHIYVNHNTRKAFRLSRRFQIFLICALASTNCLLGMGVTRKSFNFEFGGLAGMALGEARVASYSLMSIGSSIPSSVEDPSNFGIRFIQITYYFFAFVMPFTSLGIMQLLFSLPMKITTQRIWFALAEIANAWSAVEVFVISIVAALFEIETFASFVIGDRCDLVDDALKRWFDEEMHGDDKCYTVKASVGAGSWFLFCGVALSSILMFVLLRFAHHAMDERLEREGEHKLGINECVDIRTAGESATGRTLVDSLVGSCLGSFLFEEVESQPGDFATQSLIPNGHDNVTSEYRSTPEKNTMSGFWEEWRNTHSVT